MGVIDDGTMNCLFLEGRWNSISCQKGKKDNGLIQENYKEIRTWNIEKSYLFIMKNELCGKKLKQPEISNRIPSKSIPGAFRKPPRLPVWLDWRE